MFPVTEKRQIVLQFCVDALVSKTTPSGLRKSQTPFSVRPFVMMMRAKTKKIVRVPQKARFLKEARAVMGCRLDQGSKSYPFLRQTFKLGKTIAISNGKLRNRIYKKLNVVHFLLNMIYFIGDINENIVPQLLLLFHDAHGDLHTCL